MTGPASTDHTLDAPRIAELSALVRLNHRAAALYATVGPTLANVGRRQTLLRFRDDHRRLADELSGAIRRAGGTVPEPTPIGPIGARVAGAGDRRLFATVCRHARRARSEYLRVAARHERFPQHLRERLQTAADELGRQCEWADGQLAALPRPTGMSAARERITEFGELAFERRPSPRSLAVGVIALGVGFAAGFAIDRRRRG